MGDSSCYRYHYLFLCRAAYYYVVGKFLAADWREVGGDLDADLTEAVLRFNRSDLDLTGATSVTEPEV